VPGETGLLTNVPTDIVDEPGPVNVTVVGRVMVYARLSPPVTVKAAAVTGKLAFVRILGPVAVRAPAVETVTVPPVPETISPNCKAAVFVMAMAGSIVVVIFDVALACANADRPVRVVPTRIIVK